ncbi:MAG: hypothetical protein QG599_3515 [Pseudomonadota bacterium]|nr:hypothetical protein [Pseudomonadota bacterium]
MIHQNPLPIAEQLAYASLQALRAYLDAIAEQRPYQERRQLAHTWMTMARQKVNHHHSDGLDASLQTSNDFQPR